MQHLNLFPIKYAMPFVRITEQVLKDKEQELSMWYDKTRH